MSDRNERREREIAERARELFRQSVRDLDGPTRSRLAQARTRAVDAAAGRRGWWLQPSRLVPIGGVAAAALVVALILQEPPPAGIEPGETQVLNDLDLLLEGEELELLEELEFYAWLLEQPELLVAEDDGNG